MNDVNINTYLAHRGSSTGHLCCYKEFGSHSLDLSSLNLSSKKKKY